jgi:hypothetical protein
MGHGGSMHRRSTSVLLLATCLLALPHVAAKAEVRVATLDFSVTVEPPNPAVGDHVTVAFDVSADGVAGIQHYQLNGALQLFEGVTVPEPHSTYFPDRVVFDLTAVRPGSATLTLLVNYEAQHCDGDQCYYAFRNQTSPPVEIFVHGGPGDLPDLVPTRVGLLAGGPVCPPAGIFVCVENRGSAPANGFQVRYDAIDGPSDVRFFPSLPAHQDACVAIGRPGGGEFVPNEPGHQIVVRADTMDEVDESDEGNNLAVLDVPVQEEPPGGCPTPTPTPSAQLSLDPEFLNLPCQGSFEVSIAVDGPADQDVTVTDISLHHGYSQGEYGTGFSWDLSALSLPVELAPGAHLTIPISYQPGSFDSRLYVDVSGIAENGSPVSVEGIYHGRRCETPGPSFTPSPTPTPLPPGDLGVVEISGIVYDGNVGIDSGIAFAQLFYKVPSISFGQGSTDADGRFALRVQLYETDGLSLRVDAPGYQSNRVSFGPSSLRAPLEVPLYPVPQEGDPLEVDSPLCAADCNGDLSVDISELVTAVGIAVGNSSLESCRAADPDGDREITIANLIRGVDNALAGCRSSAPNDALGRIDTAWAGPHGAECGIDVVTFGARESPQQEFTPEDSQLSGVAVLLFRGSTVRTAQVDVEIHEGAAAGPLVGTASTTTHVYSYDWVEFQFTPPLLVTSGAKYVIVLSTESPYFQWAAARGVGQGCTSTAYYGGDAFDSGERDPDIDFIFATFGRGD